MLRLGVGSRSVATFKEELKQISKKLKSDILECKGWYFRNLVNHIGIEDNTYPWNSSSRCIFLLGSKVTVGVRVGSRKVEYDL
jgi:hypothetical protein